MKKLVILCLLLVACAVQVQVQPTPAPIIETSTPVEKIATMPTETPVPFCIGGDNGNEFVKGTVRSATDMVTDSCLVKKDSMVPLSKVVEYSCDGAYIIANVMNCEFGCKAGACIDGKNLPKQSLISGGKCLAGVNSAGITVTRCANECLPNTLCSPQPLKTEQFSLPYQLGCVVRSEEWAQGDWFEFEVSRPVDILLFTEVEGSELVTVELRGPSPIILLAQKGQSCFRGLKSVVRASLVPGKYVVHASARGLGEGDALRSFRGISFSVALVP
jgi:hypothetical protein